MFSANCPRDASVTVGITAVQFIAIIEADGDSIRLGGIWRPLENSIFACGVFELGVIYWNGVRLPERNLKILFERSPALFLVLDAHLIIVTATDAYLRATMTERAQIAGKQLFEVFPDNPDDPAASGVQNLKTSLKRAFKTKRPDAMPVQKVRHS